MDTGRIIAIVLIGITVGLVFSLAVTPLFIFLRKIFYVPIIRKRLFEKAKADGHIIEATLVKTISGYYAYEEADKDLKAIETRYVYHYDCGGKIGKYVTDSTNTPPEKITLYYIKNPRKATAANELGTYETPWTTWAKSYLVISLVIAIAATIVIMIAER